MWQQNLRLAKLSCLRLENFLIASFGGQRALNKSTRGLSKDLRYRPVRPAVSRIRELDRTWQ
jgi:hypothetical protein